MTNRTTAGLLALFLGGIGIHKFYLNRPIQGFLYLIFCWTFIPAVVAFLEAISYFSYSDSSWNKVYNNVDTPTPQVATANVVSREQKTCPDCAEFVLAEAKKCKHCGCFFETAS